MKSFSECKRMAVDAMVKYQDNDEIFELAQALEEMADLAESATENTQTEVAA